MSSNEDAPPGPRAAPAPDYEVGYGRPPKHTRFQPGRSGNPSGSSKGQRSAREAVDRGEVLAEQILLKEGGIERRMSRETALLKALYAKALKGDTRAAGFFLPPLPRARAEEPGDGAPEDGAAPLAVEAQDAEVIERYLDREAERRARRSRPAGRGGRGGGE